VNQNRKGLSDTRGKEDGKGVEMGEVPVFSLLLRETFTGSTARGRRKGGRAPGEKKRSDQHRNTYAWNQYPIVLQRKGEKGVMQ